MKCDECGSRFPYAEVYIFDEFSYWVYLCKDCYKHSKEALSAYGYYELSRTERISVAIGLTSLWWKVQTMWWSITYKYNKLRKKDLSYVKWFEDEQ